MSVSGIQGQLLEVTVVACNRLKNTEWISRQDPYVCLEYASSKHRTRTCTDGGKNPTFQEKFMFTLIEGLREITIMVWNSNNLSLDDFIGSGKVQLHKALSQGYDDSSWPIQDKRGRHSGEVRLILHYSNVNKPGKTHGASAPPYTSAQPTHQPPPVVTYPPTTNYAMPPPPTYPSYPPPPSSVHYPVQPPPYNHHQPVAAYPPTYPPSYPPQPTYPPTHNYPPNSYPPGAYPPPPYS